MRGISLVGKRFGRWIVLEETNIKDIRRCYYLLCKCDCGTIRKVSRNSLVSNASKSCGCLPRDIAKSNFSTHGMSNTRLYRIWLKMKSRCYDQTQKSYEVYGGRGITVCEEWRESFETFKDWALANGYADNLTLDRENNDKGYSPDNCRWATTKEQGRNKRVNIYVDYLGQTKCLTEWAEFFNINPATVLGRFKVGVRPPELFSSNHLRNGRPNMRYQDSKADNELRVTA